MFIFVRYFPIDTIVLIVGCGTLLLVSVDHEANVKNLIPENKNQYYKKLIHSKKITTKNPNNKTEIQKDASIADW